jgi:hypothetical protein
MALGILIVVAGLGGITDTAGGASLKGLFSIGLIAGSIIAILAVRRAEMFPVIIAPPLVYFGASAVMLYLRTDHLHNKDALIDAASNWLVYGFPAIAGASAAVLLIAGIRMLANR